MESSVHIYAPVGRIDSSNASAAEKEVLGKAQGLAPQLLMDLSRVDYLSSAGLRVLLMAAKACRAAGGKTVIQSPTPAVLQVLTMSGFDKIIPMASSREQALAQLAA